MSTSIETFFRPGSERGAPDAYGFRCECGAEQTTSLKTELSGLIADHRDWHGRNEQRARCENVTVLGPSYPQS